MTLVSTHELDNSLSGNAKLIDASWHFLSNRNGFKEYQKEHIENAIFFDLEKHSNQQKNLPHNHFLPKKGDCCVYCSYGNVKCPPIQKGECC